jgi:hypothetical protein
MNRTFHNPFALSTLVAVILLQSLLLSVSNGSATGAPAELNLRAEIQSLESFDDALSLLEKNVKDLSRKTSITAQELNLAQTSANTVKSRAPQLQQTFRSVVDKLRAAGKLDDPESVLPPVRDAKLRRLIQQEGGARRILETLAAQSGTLSQEIDALVQPLNSRVRAGLDSQPERVRGIRSRLVRAAYNPPAPIYLGFLRCMVRYGIYLIKPTEHNADMGICACGRAAGEADSDSYCPGGSNFTPR